MDWTDTLLFDSPAQRQGGSSTKELDMIQVFPVQGVTLLQAVVCSELEAMEALSSLQGFRAAGRRVVLCDTSCLSETYHAAERQLGHALVEQGGANLVISCGKAGREVAIGARDEGLELSNVVVCGDARSACEVLTHQLVPGDTVLLLGVEDDTRARITMSLEKRLSLADKAA